MIDHLTRHQNAADACILLKSRGQVHAVAQQIVAFDNHVAQMHADAKGQRVCGGVQFALNGDSRGHAFDDRWKFGDQPVACGVGDAPAPDGNGRVDHTAGTAQGLNGVHLVAGHTARIIRGIG